MQPAVETPQPLPRQSISTKAIVGILFLLWTLFLSGITWEIQHSCAPIVSWNGTLPAKCHPKEDRTAQRRNASPRGESLVPSWLISPHNNQNNQSDRTSAKPQNNRVTTSRDRNPSDKMPPNTVGAAAGTAVAIVSAIAGAPAIVTVGLGVAVWFFVKFFAKAASVS